MIGAGLSGWQPYGIGSPSAYPSGFLLLFPLTFAVAVLGHHGAAMLFLAAVGLIAAFGARAWALDCGCDEFAASAAAIFAVLNPWAYTKLVAGHEYMLLAYAASLWLFRELLRSAPRAVVVTAAALLTAQQLQFFFVSTLALAVHAATRRAWKPLALVLVVWLPTVAGVAMNGRSLAAIPLLVSWEKNQSIRFTDALQLNGYFAHYADAFRGFFACATIDVFALAVVAAVLPPYSRKRTGIALATLAALLVATGTRGPLGASFAWLVEHVHAVGLFRELYDVLAFAAIGMIALAASLSARLRPAGWFWLLAALLLPVAWLRSPPARFWMWDWQIPPIAMPTTAANERFALVPAFQPMSLRGRGSGADPDAVTRLKNLTLVNEYVLSYPASAALGAFAATGDVQPLEALSVGVVVARPWLETDDTALVQQWALPFHGFPQRPMPLVRRLHPLPELSLLPVTTVGTLDANLGAGNIFFGDAARVRGALAPASWGRLRPIVPVHAPSAQTHAASGWVHAELAFAQRPELAQGLGGALTTDRAARLAVRGGLDALVDVEGVLRGDDGRIVARPTRGYRWVPIPDGVHAITCDGLCVVAAQGDPPSAPLDPPPHAARAVAFRLTFPWLVSASLPPGPAGTLRYNVAYGSGWTACLRGRPLTHLRLDVSVNGWLVPRRTHSEPLVLVEVPAAVQLGLECVAILAVAAWAAWLLFNRLRAYRRESARSCPDASSSS